MQLMSLLHKFFKKELACIHKKRLQGLMDACAAAVVSNKLYLTGLGRELNNKNKTGSNIQKIDRLLGNQHLQKEQERFYSVMASHVIRTNKHPWIHIDWTCINAVTKLYALRASLSMSGRAIVLYEECHPKKKENNHSIHVAFLNQLQKILPPEISPTIVTDAGFRGPWFKHILKLGWNFVGRLRNKNSVLLNDEGEWRLSATFFKQATSKPTHIGSGLLTQEHQLPVHIVLYRGERKNRHRYTRNKKASASGKSKRYSKANKEPWVLVTSLPLTSELALQAVNIYRQRMRIEENIRDTKCPYYGLGLKKSLSRCVGRMGILLLIAAIATFAAWLAGILTTNRGKAADFQAHSSKFKSILSKVYLGREALKRSFSITKDEFKRTLEFLHHVSLKTQLEGIFI